MCDTMVAVGSATADGSVIFAKNTDREPNEAHQLVIVPAASHDPGSTVMCTYIEIPQVEETYEVLLAKPFWMWGTEMGANEKGVVIGNEAVFTRLPYEKGPGLTGMDLMRLALERATTARQAVDTIIHLLDKYGQGGNCGFSQKFFYHNSFIVADSYQAWVLETAGKQWALEKVRGVRSISNALTIGSEWDQASPDIVALAREKGWCKRGQEFSFAGCYSDPLQTRLRDGILRQCRSMELLATKSITVHTMMSILRDHGPQSISSKNLRQGILGSDICMHAGYGPVRNSQTTGSMVSHLLPQVQTHWLTGTAAPCTSIFKPVWMDSGLPVTGPVPKGTYDHVTMWWSHEALHRQVLQDYTTRISIFNSDRDQLENSFIENAHQVTARGQNERALFSKRCFIQSEDATRRWTEMVCEEKIKSRPGRLYQAAWIGFNKKARFPQPATVHK
jgi:secernin